MEGKIPARADIVPAQSIGPRRSASVLDVLDVLLESGEVGTDTSIIWMELFRSNPGTRSVLLNILLLF